MLPDCLSPLFLIYQTVALAAVLFSMTLYCQAQGLLLLFVCFATGAVLVVFTHAQSSFDEQRLVWVETSGLVKLLCVLSLGLGSILLFSSLTVSFRQRFQTAFASYVNLAVLANIGMMAFLPGGGTWRGETSRAACAVLCAWLWLEIRRVGWSLCVSVTDVGVPLFVFSASPLSWVLCHALYRAVMITLPVFDPWRYVLLEPASLCCMLVAHRVFSRRRPGASAGKNTEPTECLSHYFGIADTIAVATLGTVSHLSDHIIDPRLRPMSPFEQCSIESFWSAAAPTAADYVDRVGVALHCAVIAVAVMNILRLVKFAR
jgi:hypothetical protein